MTMFEIIPIVVAGVFGLIVVIFVVLIILAIVYGVSPDARRKQLAEMCGKNGWTFDPEPYEPDEELFPAFYQFRDRDDQECSNTMRGKLVVRGLTMEVHAGDFKYTTTDIDDKGRSETTTHRFSYMVVCLPWPGVPDLFLRRESFIDRIAGAMGFDDIDFESAEFSRKFHVKSPDRKFAFAVIHPRMIEFLMSEDPPPIILLGGMLGAFGIGTWSAEEFDRRRRFASDFLERWPDYLVAELSARPSS